LFDSGTAQIIGSIDQVAALNAALGGVPSIQSVPFDCGKAVAAVLGATAQALATDDPDTAANLVSIYCWYDNSAGVQHRSGPDPQCHHKQGVAAHSRCMP
jgi:hypothetical protein